MILVTNFYASTSNGRKGYAFIFPKYPVSNKDFQATLKRFKAKVPYQDREWREDSKEWWVSAEYDLSDLFANWEDSLDRVRRQLELPL